MKLVTRVFARVKGYMTYFTGVECLNGNIAERRTDATQCCECQRQRSKDWNTRNNQRVIDNVAAWKDENAEYVSVYRHEHRLANYDRVRAQERVREAARRVG